MSINPLPLSGKLGSLHVVWGLRDGEFVLGIISFPSKEGGGNNDIEVLFVDGPFDLFGGL